MRAERNAAKSHQRGSYGPDHVVRHNFGFSHAYLGAHRHRHFSLSRQLLSSYGRAASFSGKENQQRTAAKELLWIREQLLLLIMDCHMPSVPLIQLQKCLEMINRELTAVYKFAPNTSSEAYAAADKSLKSGHFTFSDDEIDGFLPTVLRKKL